MSKLFLNKNGIEQWLSFMVQKGLNLTLNENIDQKLYIGENNVEIR